MLMNPVLGLLFLLLGIAFTPFHPASAAEDAGSQTCEAYREYRTSYNYLLSKKSLAFTKDQASLTAMKVAEGCTGSAERFIRVFDLLLNAQLTLADANEIALEVAWSDQDSADSFAEIFKVAYLEEYLDLSLQNAINLARTLSAELKFSSALARKEFEKLVQFCLSAKGLALPKPSCAKLSLQILKQSEESEFNDISTSFVELIEFLRTQNDGPRLSTGDALEVAKDVIGIHIDAGKNFIPAYKFASDGKNLGLNRSKAIEFAKNLANLSKRRDKPEVKN